MEYQVQQYIIFLKIKHIKIRNSLSGDTLITAYNKIYADNYKHFIAYAKQDSDAVNQQYLKIRARFETLDFTGTTIQNIYDKIYAYIKLSIYNTYLTKKRLERDILSPDTCHNEMEQVLQREQSYTEDNLSHEQQLEYVTRMLFEYIKQKYPETHNYVFRCYYLYDKDKRITYQQLSQITGFSISKCCQIIKTMKADIRNNLINYINNHG